MNDQKRKQAIERLKAEKDTFDDKSYKLGEKVGREWALGMSYVDLVEVAACNGDIDKTDFWENTRTDVLEHVRDQYDDGALHNEERFVEGLEQGIKDFHDSLLIALG